MKLRKTATTASLLVVFGLTPLAALWSSVHQTHAAEASLALAGVPTDRPAEQYVGSFLDTTTEAVLRRAGVTVTAQDKVYAFPDPALGIGSTVFVYRAQVVKLTDAGKPKTVRTWAKTMAEFAAEQHLDLGAKDETSLATDAPIAVQDAPVEVVVNRVAETEVTVTSSIAYITQYIDDATIERGITKKEQVGVAGSLKTTYLVRRKNGVEVSRTKIKTERTKEPVTEIIRRGTKVIVFGTGKATYCIGDGSIGRSCRSIMSAASNTLPRGTRVRVVNVANGKSVVVTIYDKGIQGSAIIDLSQDAFAAIGNLRDGWISVRIEKE